MDEQFIIEIWDAFRDYIPEKGRDVAAQQYVDFLLSKDVDLSVIESLLGFDPHLDEAIENTLEENKEDEDNDFDEYEEDEEY